LEGAIKHGLVLVAIRMPVSVDVNLLSVQSHDVDAEALRLAAMLSGAKKVI
jgi:hypothetical protein